MVVGLTVRVSRSKLYIKVQGRVEAWSSVRKIIVRDTGISGGFWLVLCFLRGGSGMVVVWY